MRRTRAHSLSVKTNVVRETKHSAVLRTPRFFHKNNGKIADTNVSNVEKPLMMIN